jgi:hypothetical protein
MKTKSVRLLTATCIASVMFSFLLPIAYSYQIKNCTYGIGCSDTDRDGLWDIEEKKGMTLEGKNLVDTNPGKRDVYIVVGVTNNTDFNKQKLKREFQNMNIRNPSGETGINLHVKTKTIDEKVVWNRNKNDFNKIKHRYKQRLLADEPDVYSSILLVEDNHPKHGGYAEVGGRFSIVGNSKSMRLFVHEILHMYLGYFAEECKNPSHICNKNGYMNQIVHPKDDDLSEKTRHRIRTERLSV